MKFFAYTVLFSIVFSLFARVGVVVNYFIDQNYYATVLCEKKDEVKSCCRGKCAMAKELKNMDDKEEKSSSKSQNSVLKFSKASEALCKSLQIFIEEHFIPNMETLFSGKPEKGMLQVLIKPPCK